MTVFRLDNLALGDYGFITLEQIATVIFHISGYARNEAVAMVRMADGNTHCLRGETVFALERALAQREAPAR